MKLKKIADVVAGEVSGDADIRGIAPIEEAGAGDLIFVLEEKFLSPALRSKGSAIVAPLHLKASLSGKPAVFVKNPRLALAKILPLFALKKKNFTGIHQTAVIAKSAKLGKRVTIHPLVAIGEDCELGDDCVIHPAVTIYNGVRIGKRVTIHAGARIGVDGFGFVWDKDRYVKIPQVGGVIIEDDVEIFANVTIARGTIGNTRIGAGTKIDCLSHLAHNCDLGRDCAIVSLVGLAGSVTLKDHVSVGGQAGFNGHVTVGENTVVVARAGVTKDLPANSVVSGFPAIDHKKDLALQAIQRKLPALYKKLKR